MRFEGDPNSRFVRASFRGLFVASMAIGLFSAFESREKAYAALEMGNLREYGSKQELTIACALTATLCRYGFDLMGRLDPAHKS